MEGRLEWDYAEGTERRTARDTEEEKDRDRYANTG